MIMNKITNVNPRTHDGNTSFHTATSGGHLEICKTIMNSLIIRDFSEFHPKDDKGLTPLHEVAAKYPRDDKRLDTSSYSSLIS